MKAYFDESGKHKQAEVLTMAGIVASKSSWEKLQNRWMKTLHRLKVETPFHASDCATGTKKFKGLKLEHREEIQAALIDTMKGLHIQAAATSIVRRHYNEAIATELRPTEGNYIVD